MAVAFKTALGSGVATSSGTTITITTTAAIAVDDLVVVRWASDNLNATTPTATCSIGGVQNMTLVRQGAVNATAAAGVAGGMLVVKSSGVRATGTNIVVTLSGAVAHKAAYAESFTGAEDTVRSTAVSATGASTAAVSPASGTVVAGDLVLGFVAYETRGTLTGDADTGGGTWSTISRTPSATSGSDATCVQVGGQYKIPNSATAQTFNIGGASAEWVIGVGVLQASPEPSLTQDAYRFYDEQGTESGATALAAQDTPVNGDIGNGDGYGVIRIRLQSTTAVAVPLIDDWDLQYEKNASGTWLAATSGAVVGYDAPQLTEGATTTKKLTGGTGAYGVGKGVSEVSKVTDRGWGGTDHTELVYSVRLVAAQLALGDTLRFRVARNGGTVGMTYTSYPTINIVQSLTWAGSIGTIGAAGVSSDFVPGTAVWGLTIHRLEPFNDFTTNGWMFAAGTPTIVAGRTGTAAQIPPSGQLAYVIPAPSSDIVTVGAAIKDPGGGGHIFDMYGDGGSILHTSVQVNATGAVLGYRGATYLFQTANGVILPDVWYYMEAQFKLHDTTGYLVVKVNGVTVLNLLDRDTRNAGSAAVYSQLRLGFAGASNNLFYDDLYWTIGPTGTFVGDLTIPPTTYPPVPTVGVEGVSGSFILVIPPQTWVGSTATVGAAGTSGAFTLAAGPDQVWGGSEAYTDYSLFHQTPMGDDSGPGDTDENGVVLGTRVMFAEPGQVTGVWFQKGNTADLIYYVALWQQTGPADTDVILLADRGAGMGTGMGWFYQDFNPPVDVGPLADVSGIPMSYVVTCHYPQDPAVGAQELNYSVIPHGFDSAWTDGPITAPAGNVDNNAGRNGRFVYSSWELTYPHQSFNNNNYLIDVQFTVLSYIEGSSLGSIGVDGISGEFTATAPPPQTWAGSTAAAGVAALSGLFTPGATTWAGSTATAGIAGTSGVFVAGVRVWSGSTATAGVAGISSAFIAGARTWAGSTATVGVSGVSDVLVAGTVIWAGSTATAGIAGISGEFLIPAGPPQIWGDGGPPELDVLTGLAIWFDISQLDIAGGSTINPWPNLGSGDAGFMVGLPLPTVRNDALNGLPVVRFFLQGGRLRMTGTGINRNYTVVYVARLWDSAIAGRILGATYPPNNVLFGWWNGMENAAYDNGFLVPDTKVPQTTDWIMYSADDDGVTGSRMFRDGQYLCEFGGAAGFGGTLSISGYSPAGAEETPDCEVAEVVMYDHKLSDLERQSVEDYLRAKWFEPVSVGPDIAALGVFGVSGELIAGAATWGGSSATAGVAGVTGAFAAGPITWAGSTATVGVAGSSAAFVPGPATWIGSVATVGVAGATGNFSSAGQPQTWSSSTATVGVAGQTAPFVPGPRTWTGGSTATVGVFAVSAPMVPGVRVWSGSTATVGVAGVSGVFVGGAFRPDKLTGLASWFDASTLGLADGADVTLWPDLAGDLDLTPITGYRPKFKANELNGLGVVRFGGVNQEHLGASTYATFHHFFIVAKFRLAQFPNYNGLLGSDGNLILVGGGPGTTDFYSYTQSSYYKNGVSLPTMSGPMADWAHMGVTNTGGWINWRVWIGCDRGFADRQWDGDVAEVIGYDRVLTDPERIQVENYLKEKWLPDTTIGQWNGQDVMAMMWGSTPVTEWTMV